MRRKILNLLCIMALLLGICPVSFGEAEVTSILPDSAQVTSILPASLQDAETAIDPTALRIQILNNPIKIWDMIEFTVANAPATENAWVGLFEYKDEALGEQYYWSDSYSSKIMVKNLGTTPYFVTPKSVEPARYVIAVFDSYGYEIEPVAISEAILVQGMFLSPNPFIPEEFELAHQYELLINDEKGNGTYDIKSTMNHGSCNPYITDQEVQRYQAFLNSDTIHEFLSKNIQGADGLWSVIGPSENWYSFGNDGYSEEDYDNGLDSTSPVTVFTNFNCDAANGKPSNPTKFTLPQAQTVTYMELMFKPISDSIKTKVSLVDKNGSTFTSWDAYIDPPFDGESYSSLFIEVNQKLPAGTYTVKVSNPSGWLSNANSNYEGMAYIEGLYDLSF